MNLPQSRKCTPLIPGRLVPQGFAGIGGISPYDRLYLVSYGRQAPLAFDGIQHTIIDIHPA